MKKVFSVMMVAFALMMAVPAQAQLIKFGVKGGMNFSELDFDKKKLGDVAESSTGFFIGPMAEVTLPIVGLGVDGALMFSQRGKGDTKQQGIEVPVNLKYTFGLGSMFGFYLAAGPDFFFNFKDITLPVWVGDDATYDTKVSKKTQVALNLGAGLKLLRKLQVGVTYQVPMGNSFDLKNVDVKNKTWQVSLAYIF